MKKYVWNEEENCDEETDNCDEETDCLSLYNLSLKYVSLPTILVSVWMFISTCMYDAHFVGKKKNS